MNDSGVFFIFSSCYALNMKAMKRIINLQENNLLPPDTPLNDKELTGSFAIINLAIQDPKNKTMESETYGKIGLNINNYENEDDVISSHGVVVAPKKSSTGDLEKKIKITKSHNTGQKYVVFGTPVKPQTKNILEPTLKKGPTPTKKTFIVDKRKKPTKTRVIVGKSSGYNKLYDF